MEEITLTCTDGIRLCGQRWRRTRRTTPKDHVVRILCLHGFLDNCRTHHLIAPHLASFFEDNNREVDVVAMDLPGHGLSSHKSRDVPSSWVVSDYCYYVAQMVTRLGWVTKFGSIDNNADFNEHSFILIGHSFGGTVSIMYTATFPEQVRALILLDSHGPDYESPERISSRLRQHVLDRYDYNQKTNPTTNTKRVRPKEYSNLRAAVQTRMDTARFSPGGHQRLTEKAATEMVQRAIRFNSNGTIQFLHDARLKHSPLLLHTPEHVDTFWSNLHCPVYCLMAEEGWPFYDPDIQRAHDQLRNKNNDSNGKLTVDVLPGSHHFHADPETASAVATAIVNFLCRQGV
jgi:pimeloyl-ACP methyl ester carboxylesterase